MGDIRTRAGDLFDENRPYILMLLFVATCHATFSASPNDLGRFFSLETLWLSVPRKCSQSLPEPLTRAVTTARV